MLNLYLYTYIAFLIDHIQLERRDCVQRDYSRSSIVIHSRPTAATAGIGDDSDNGSLTLYPNCLGLTLESAY